MSELIKPHERVDDLQLNGLKLIQNPSRFCFGVDAVLLSHFSLSSIKKDSSVLDLCSGNGIIPILLSEKSLAKKITGVEIQPSIADMAKRSIILNNLSGKVDFICEDLKNSVNLFGKGAFDTITCNPPYKENGGGLKNINDSVTIARHEILCTLEDVIHISSELLKPLGKLCIVHRPERLTDIIITMKKYKIELKRLKFIHPSYKKTATMILAEGSKLGRPKLFLEPPLYIHDENGNYTLEIDKIYGRNRTK